VTTCVTQTHWTSVAGDVAAICGVSSVRTSVRQQPIFSICRHCPCIERQQALSSRLITTLVTHAITGAAAVSMRRTATMLAKRRIDTFIIGAFDSYAYRLEGEPRTQLNLSPWRRDLCD
jgi:hypothetical protein